MALWELLVDPNVAAQPTWPGIRAINRQTNFLGSDRYLVEADAAAIAPLHAHAGILEVKPARDGPYVDDSGRTDHVVNGVLRSP
jgi:hypothetical protein